MKLKPIREWQEKEGKRVLRTIRLYMGNLHVATVCPSKSDPSMYTCSTMIDILLPVKMKGTLEDIKLDIELTLKDFINKITTKTLRRIGEPTK